MESLFCRNMPSLTAEEQGHLEKGRVFVAGCGGIGGHVIELLLRLGVGHITAADGDFFVPSNRNRQILSLDSNLGENKALAAKRRAGDINPAVDFRAVETMLDGENLPLLLDGCDLVIDALDSPEARIVLADACGAMGLALIHGAVYGWMAQVAVIPPGSGLVRRLYNAPPAERPPTVLSLAPALCAAVECAEAAKLLAGRKSDLAGKLFIADLETMDVEIVELA